jgi:hypothetical protein
MANPEHVEIVKQGAEAICRWREESPLECELLFPTSGGTGSFLPDSARLSPRNRLKGRVTAGTEQ